MATVISYQPNKCKFPPQVYPDANFLLSSYVPKHQFYKRAATLLLELAYLKIEVHASLLAVEEAIYILLKIKYEDIHGKKSWDANKPLRTDANVCKQFYPELDKFVKKLLALPYFRIIDYPTTASVLLANLLDNIKDYSLAPRDALHLAVLKAAGLSMIVTNDSDFDRVSDTSIQVLHF